MHPARYDALLQSGERRDALERMRIVRVSELFRVVALGLPVPPFRGQAMDPPLRSRLQARRVDGVLPTGHPVAVSSQACFDAMARTRLSRTRDLVCLSLSLPVTFPLMFILYR